MDDEIMKAIEQAAIQADNDQSRVEKEVYIETVVNEIRSSAYNHIRWRTTVLPEPMKSQMNVWQDRNNTRLSIQIGEVVRILLRKELLGE